MSHDITKRSDDAFLCQSAQNDKIANPKQFSSLHILKQCTCNSFRSHKPRRQSIPYLLFAPTPTPKQVPTTTASTSSPVSKDETAPPSAPLEPASTSEIDEDVGIIITDEDFCEVADIFAADNGTVEFTPPGTAPATGVAAGGDEAEASNRLAPLSPSTAGGFGSLSFLSLMA